ncbi:O-antigen ligase [Pseudomonas sp. MYb185]|uniref:O-antigen ligase family protein n=1 Tax=Pseudomonas sp. MYb185 TaxID=1848729 RepID=UPI000CFD33F8|nr:O-antigen ligase family protein [Pseudomonas sp. MYb185]PRB84453.1 hypothetical protein CQ007_01350 [Pseudomonas sp. MYb185]
MQLLLGMEARFVRLNMATGMLLLLVFITPFLNWNSTAVWVNSQIALMQLLFTFLLLPEMKRCAVCMFKQSSSFRLTLGFAIVACVGCMLVNPDTLYKSRLWLYWIQLFFFVAAVAWFSGQGDKRLVLLLASKLCSVVLVCVFLLHAMEGDVVSRRDVDFPFYRNVRHLNYDLAVGVVYAIALWVMVRGGVLSGSLFFLLFVVFGFFTLFTEGRGQLLSSLFFLFIGFFAMSSSMERAVLAKAGVGFLLGAGLLILMYPETLDWLLARSFSDSPDRVSSGRFFMWGQSMEVWLNNSPGLIFILFGLGPDSFRLLNVSPGYVHPHNSLIQVALEFGVIGVCLLFYIKLQVLRLVGRIVGAERQVLPCLIGVGVLCMLIYSLIDGVLYHGSPLLMCVLMGAYIFSSVENYRI